MKRVLVVDDDRRMRRTLQLLIESMGLEAAGAADVAEAGEQLRAAVFDLVLSDLKLPGASGLDLLDEIKARHPELPVIVITAYGTIQTAIEAIRKGASDYVLKPFDNESLKVVIRKALELERFRSENDFLRRQADEPWAPAAMLRALPGLRAVAELIERIAPSAGAVLVTGETGTGKELAARCVHDLSPRRERLFVPINCAALPADLLEAELFGHARGAFTGADRERRGKLEIADGGTLFLDEIGDMPLGLQAKLLRVLEDGVVEPLGTNRSVRVDARVISATNQNLEEAIAAKRFRDDLFYRLNTFEVRLPPLRARGGDVDVLAAAFLERSVRELGKRPMRLAADALALLRAYDWPGNVRELRNLMERAAVLSADDVVPAGFFEPMVRSAGERDGRPRAAGETEGEVDAALPLGEAVQGFERRVIQRTLGETGDNKAEAARRLGISERNLWYKIKRLGLGSGD